MTEEVGERGWSGRQGAVSQEGSVLLPSRKAGMPWAGHGCWLVKALSISRACDQSLPDA